MHRRALPMCCLCKPLKPTAALTPPAPSPCSPKGDTTNCIKVSAETTTAISLGQLPGEECAAKYGSREEAVTELYQVCQLV